MTHITIQRSAMEAVLEALWTTANPKAEEAITAIKEALAQGETSSPRAAQEPWCMKVVDCHATGVCVQSGLRAEKPAQEPVVWPFPPATGAIPWTKQQEKDYQQQKQEQLPAAPF
jgi:hypothetical protein